MGGSGSHSHLKLTQSVEGRADDSRPVQVSLFLDGSEPVVCIVHMPTITGARFVDALHSLKPLQVFDFRTVPSFSIGRLNRLEVFRLFESVGSTYYDVPALVGVGTRVEARLKGKAMSDAVADAVGSSTGPFAIMVLLDDPDAVRAAASSLPRVLSKHAHAQWALQVER